MHIPFMVSDCLRKQCSTLILVAVGLMFATSFSSAGENIRKNPRMLIDASDGTNWPAYGRTFDESHYSPLNDINDKNVQRLGLAWWFDLPPGTSVTAPLAVDGVVYITSGQSVLRAFDARSGRLLWRYDPEVTKSAGQKLRGAWGARGIAWWKGKIYVGTMDGRLIAVDAKTGKPVWSSQTTKPDDGLYVTGAPRAFNGKILIGNGGADFAAVRGYVTAYDADTGKQIWRFYTVPGNPKHGFENKAMEMAAKTWSGEWWEHGGGGTAWNALTYDPEYNRVYIGTGNGAPWNPKVRSPGGGDNLFLCSIVALDADTGAYVWHYQVNPAEAWDYTATMDIQLATLDIGGEKKRVLMQAPKNGFFYVIDRDTGKPISAEPFVKVTWAKGIDLATGRPIENPDARADNSVATIWPGGSGGHNWEPMSYSPLTGLVYIPATELPGSYDDRGITPQTWQRRPGMVVNTGYNVPDFSVPVPPEEARLGSLKAWDPVAQREVWNVPQRAAHSGGVLSTAGNLVIQGQEDGQFVARNALTGEQLWAFDAQNGIIGQTITYRADGRQQITVLTGLSNNPSLFGGISSQFGWTYRSQQRRVLTFVLDGRAKLPSATATGPEQPLAAPDFVVDQTLAAAGSNLYNSYCFTCHGAGATAGGAAPDLRASPLSSAFDAFYQVVQGGALVDRGMPRFEELTRAEMVQLQHYIRREAGRGLVPAQ